MGEGSDAGCCGSCGMGRYRWALLGVACIHVLIASGAAYGWTALRPVLYDSGIFAGYSDWERASKMNLVSTLGISANALCKLPLGVFMDYFGPRYTSILGALFLSLGSLLMAYGDKDSVPSFAAGYFLLGISGPFIQMPCFQFSNLFPETKTTTISAMITCFELSTGVFYVFNVMHGHGGFDMRALFAGYATIGLFIAITAAAMWPDTPHGEYRPDEELKEGDDEEDVLLDPPPLPPLPDVLDEEDDLAEGEPMMAPPPPMEGLIGQPLSKQLMSVEFGYVACFLMTHIFRQGFVLATLGLQLEHFFEPALASKLADSFSIILPLGFLPMMLCTATGFSGYILNRPNVAFVTVTLLSMVYGLLFLVPRPGPYIVLFVLFPVGRQLVFSTFFSFAAQTFGFQSFGRISGIASTAAGLIQLLGNPLVSKTMDPTVPWLGWAQVDLFLGLFPVVLLAYPCWKILQQCLAGENVDENFSRESSMHGGSMHGGSMRGGMLAQPLLIGSAAGSIPVSIAGSPMLNDMSIYGSMPSFGSVPVPANYASYMMAGSPAAGSFTRPGRLSAASPATGGPGVPQTMRRTGSANGGLHVVGSLPLGRG